MAAFAALAVAAGVLLAGSPAYAAVVAASCSTDIFGHPCKTIAVYPNGSHHLNWEIRSIYGASCTWWIDDTTNGNVVGHDIEYGTASGTIPGLYATYILHISGISCEGEINGYSPAAPPVN